MQPRDDDPPLIATPLSQARARDRDRDRARAGRRSQPSRTGAHIARLARWLAVAVALWLAWMLLRLLWAPSGAAPEPALPPPPDPPPLAVPVASPPAAQPQSAAPAAMSKPIERRAPAVPAPVFDLCGVGRMPMPVQPPGVASGGGHTHAAGGDTDRESGLGLGLSDPLPPVFGRLARAEAWPQVLAQLEAGGEREQAAALVLRASGLLDFDLDRGAGGLAMGASAVTDVRPQVEALAALAARSRDAGVLRWALAQCDRLREHERLAAGPGAPAAGAGGNACDTLSPHDLAERDPDDAHGWLVRAGAATDPEARDHALQHAATAARWRTTPSGLPTLVDAAWPEGLPDYLRSELLVRALGVELSVSEGAPLTLLRHCRGSAGSEREGLCSALATMAAERGDSLIALVLAARLGQEAGWPGERVQAMRDDLTRLQARAAALESDQPWSCREVERLRTFLRLRADEGELAALRDAGPVPGPPGR